MPLLCSMEKLLNGMMSLTEFLFSVRDVTNATGSCPEHPAEQTLVSQTHKEWAQDHVKARGREALLLCTALSTWPHPKAVFSLTLFNIRYSGKALGNTLNKSFNSLTEETF